MKKPTTSKLVVATTTVRTLSTEDLKSVNGGLPPDPCRRPTLNPSGG